MQEIPYYLVQWAQMVNTFIVLDHLEQDHPMKNAYQQGLNMLIQEWLSIEGNTSTKENIYEELKQYVDNNLWIAAISNQH